MTDFDKLARDAGAYSPENASDWAFSPKEFHRFAKAVRAEALEEAAVVCDGESTVEGIAQRCAAAIRALKETA